MYRLLVLVSQYAAPWGRVPCDSPVPQRGVKRGGRTQGPPLRHEGNDEGSGHGAVGEELVPSRPWSLSIERGGRAQGPPRRHEGNDEGSGPCRRGGACPLPPPVVVDRERRAGARPAATARRERRGLWSVP